MTDDEYGWTAEQLRLPGGMEMYTDQLKQIFREHRDDLRALANDLHGELKYNPPAGDNRLQAGYHAWKTAKIMHEMEGHAQAIIKLAAKLRSTHQGLYVELPRRRAEKAEVKALQKAAQAAGQGAQVARTAGNVNDLVARMTAAAVAQQGGEAGQAGAPAVPPQPTQPPVFDMFKTGTGQ